MLHEICRCVVCQTAPCLHRDIADSERLAQVSCPARRPSSHLVMPLLPTYWMLEPGSMIAMFACGFADMGADRRVPAVQHSRGGIHDPAQRGVHALVYGSRSLQQGQNGVLHINIGFGLSNFFSFWHTFSELRCVIVKQCMCTRNWL